MNSLTSFSQRFQETQLEKFQETHKRRADSAELKVESISKFPKVTEQAWSEIATHVANQNRAEELKNKALTDLKSLEDFYSPKYKMIAAYILKQVLYQIANYYNGMNGQDDEMNWEMNTGSNLNEMSHIENSEFNTILQETHPAFYSEDDVPNPHINTVEKLALQIGKKILQNNPELLLGLIIAKDEWVSNKIQAEITKQSSIAKLDESRIRLATMQRLFAEEKGDISSSRDDLTPVEREIIEKCEQAWKNEQAHSLQLLETAIQTEVGRFQSLFNKVKSFPQSLLTPIKSIFAEKISTLEEKIPTLETRFARYHPDLPEAKRAKAMTKRLQKYAKDFIDNQKAAGDMESLKAMVSIIYPHLSILITPNLAVGLLGAPAASLIEIGKFLGGASRNEKKEIFKRNQETAINETHAETWKDTIERFQAYQIARKESPLFNGRSDEEIQEGAAKVECGEEFDSETVGLPLTSEEEEFLAECEEYCNLIAQERGE